MLCEICKKCEATIHYTEIVHNQMIKMHICEECAKSKGIGIQSPFSISDLLSGLAEVDQHVEKAHDPVCKGCGLSFSHFRQTGRLGCSECYATFKVPLESLLKTIHKAAHHTGKKYAKDILNVPEKAIEEEINLLNIQLQNAVEKEQYEHAAQLRDQIKALKTKIGLP
ncbi:UvrB/UvrC motif-containing protein [bacterium]|nr:UvrB/UvrC motif-containing protein [bacterium]MCP5462509.1 UvrB/UvrC motif-containing protein [bacterium]